MKIEHDGNEFTLTGTPQDMLNFVEHLVRTINHTTHSQRTNSYAMAAIGKIPVSLDGVYTKDYPAVLNIAVMPEEQYNMPEEFPKLSVTRKQR